MSLLKSFFILTGFLLSHQSISQKAEGKFSDFSLTDVISNQPVSLSDYNTSKVVVVIFTSNTCPYSKLYENRIIELANSYKEQGVSFLLINSNNSPLTDVDNVFRMRIKANAKKYPFPYLADKEQLAKNIFKAEKTPEIFILAKKKGILTQYYNGALDDNPQSADLVKEKYVELALNNLLKGKPSPIKHKRAIGCRIKTD